MCFKFCCDVVTVDKSMFAYCCIYGSCRSLVVPAATAGAAAAPAVAALPRLTGFENIHVQLHTLARRLTTGRLDLDLDLDLDLAMRKRSPHGSRLEHWAALHYASSGLKGTRRLLSSLALGEGLFEVLDVHDTGEIFASVKQTSTLR